MRHSATPRRGATAVEFAVVGPIVLFVLIALVVGGMGIFRYQEVAALARESARYASVHGTQYQQDTGQPAATSQEIYNNVIVAQNVSLDLSQLNYAVTWNSDNKPYHTQIVSGNVVPVTNTVQVTITYQWIPEIFLGGVTLTSTAVTPMAN
jgi:Flp pilus assembly protein TadG